MLGLLKGNWSLDSADLIYRFLNSSPQIELFPAAPSKVVEEALSLVQSGRIKPITLSLIWRLFGTGWDSKFSSAICTCDIRIYCATHESSNSLKSTLLKSTGWGLIHFGAGEKSAGFDCRSVLDQITGRWIAAPQWNRKRIAAIFQLNETKATTLFNFCHHLQKLVRRFSLLSLPPPRLRFNSLTSTIFWERLRPNGNEQKLNMAKISNRNFIRLSGVVNLPG